MAPLPFKTCNGVSAARFAWWAKGPDLALRSSVEQAGAASRRPLRVARGAARSAARFIPRTLQNTGGVMSDSIEEQRRRAVELVRKNGGSVSAASYLLKFIRVAQRRKLHQRGHRGSQGR